MLRGFTRGKPLIMLTLPGFSHLHHLLFHRYAVLYLIN